MILALTTVAVLVVDQALKVQLRTGRPARVRLGPFGSVRTVEGRLWVHRFGAQSSKALWLWVLAAGALVVGSGLMPSARLFVGLLLAGSLSNLIESAVRGSVTDYVCLRFW